MTVAHVTDKNFESEVLKSNLPVLVDFWAEVVRTMPDDHPIVERDRRKTSGGKWKVAKVNVDEAPGTGRPVQYHVVGRCLFPKRPTR